MARSDSGAASLRIPGHVRRRSSGEPPAQVEDQVPRMRLVVTKGKLGVELDQPFELGPLTLEQLALSLPQVSFPVELSGGVAAFRNKRGELERVVVSLSGKRLQAWARPRLSGLLPGRLHHHLLAPLEDGWLVGITGDASALAFTVRVAPNDDDLRLIPTEARGIGLGAPPAALATRALFALLKPHGRLVGGAVVVEGGARLLATAVAPLAGMRVPETRGLVVSWLTAEVEGMTLAAEREAAPFATGERAQRAVELASLTHDAEAALLASRVDDARRHYVAALALAPRHQGIAR
ncbi:MAG: hypothetical protein KC731_43120, partial [Myxococcales bacterium]|nr:hypothetical protein [Myxococcales bacterium]